MPEMILNRNAHLATKSGHNLAFAKNKPTYVPPSCVREAAAIGAEHADGEERTEFDDAPALPVAPVDLGQRQEDILKALDALVERNDRDDFTAAGVPTVAAVKEVVGYKVNATEIGTAWQTRADNQASKFEE